MSGGCLSHPFEEDLMQSGDFTTRWFSGGRWRSVPALLAGLLALSVFVTFLSSGSSISGDEPIRDDPTRFDPVSPLASGLWTSPTNAHPYPEALAVGLVEAGQDEENQLPSPHLASGFQSLGTARFDAQDVLLPGAVVSGLMLSAEQLHVARFYSDKYRLPIDQVAEAVANAYFTAREMRVDPLLVVAVISIESGFNPRARSSQGAEGLMQVRTFVHEEKFRPFGGAAAAWDPVANIQVGVRILRDHLLREASVEGALKAYVGAAKRRHDGGYGRRVMQEREVIQQFLAARTEADSVSRAPVIQSAEQLF
jgi:hypothetical protein